MGKGDGCDRAQGENCAVRADFFKYLQFTSDGAGLEGSDHLPFLVMSRCSCMELGANTFEVGGRLFFMVAAVQADPCLSYVGTLGLDRSPSLCILQNYTAE